MRKEDVLKLPSMPAAGPSYPAGPYRFVNREYMVITYETDALALAADLPEPLEPVEHALVHFEWIKMPDSSGFGSYTESGMVIPCRFRGEDVNFVAQMYLDDDPPRLHLVPHVNAPVADLPVRRNRRRASLPCRPHAPLRAGHLRLSQGGVSAGPTSGAAHKKDAQPI
jgi:acetoacetate decarboxylase